MHLISLSDQFLLVFKLKVEVRYMKMKMDAHDFSFISISKWLLAKLKVKDVKVGVEDIFSLSIYLTSSWKWKCKRFEYGRYDFSLRFQIYDWVQHKAESESGG